jgi:hypothetical protein
MPQIQILPQQSNYTIHTSQAVTTSRTLTQTADSQKQEKALTAMTMMIGYLGKKSAEEARKEQAPEPQKCQQ